jgi:hypothetical protein
MARSRILASSLDRWVARTSTGSKPQPRSSICTHSPVDSARAEAQLSGSILLPQSDFARHDLTPLVRGYAKAGSERQESSKRSLPSAVDSSRRLCADDETLEILDVDLLARASALWQCPSLAFRQGPFESGLSHHRCGRRLLMATCFGHLGRSRFSGAVASGLRTSARNRYRLACACRSDRSAQYFDSWTPTGQV